MSVTDFHAVVQETAGKEEVGDVERFDGDGKVARTG
jgi:hypothetical protein